MADAPEPPPSRVKSSVAVVPEPQKQLQLFVPDELHEWTEWSEPVQIRVRNGRLELRAVIVQ